jgi:hypothetical protein
VIWSQPNYEDVAEFARNIGCDWVGNIRVMSDASCEENICHANVKNYILSHQGTCILGYYFLESAWGYQAILHSVWKDNNENLIDITPFSDKRKINVFARLKDNKQKYKTNNIYSQSLDKYKQETDIMFYVYALIDPRNELPFYIGKGKGRRATTHLWEVPETRNQHKENKIAAIRSVGLEPRIEYLAEDIVDEVFAYKMETDLISRYGRKGYELYGILTNICLDSRPPNHKGKTYEEIYGKERAVLEKKKRAELQKARGGYGPKKHTSETKEKIGNSSRGEKNGMYGRTQSKETIEKIKNNRKPLIGKDHHYSKCYMLTNEVGQLYTLYGGELTKFCKENDLSLATFRKNLSNNWPPSKKGKNKGWKISVNNYHNDNY